MIGKFDSSILVIFFAFALVVVACIGAFKLSTANKNCHQRCIDQGFSGGTVQFASRGVWDGCSCDRSRTSRKG